MPEENRSMGSIYSKYKSGMPGSNFLSQKTSSYNSSVNKDYSNKEEKDTLEEEIEEAEQKPSYKISEYKISNFSIPKIGNYFSFYDL